MHHLLKALDKALALDEDNNTYRNATPAAYAVQAFVYKKEREVEEAIEADDDEKEMAVCEEIDRFWDDVKRFVERSEVHLYFAEEYFTVSLGDVLPSGYLSDGVYV